MKSDVTFSNHHRFTKSLSLWSVILFGLAFMALTTVFSTFGIASNLSKGMVAGSYILALIVMLFTAYSYGVMAKRYPIAGSAYSYVQQVINPNLGFLVGWAVMMDYLFIPMVNFMLFGIFFHDAFPMIPQWGFIIALLILVTLINLRGVKVAVTVNLIIVFASIVFAVIFCLKSIISVNAGIGTGILTNMTPIIDFSEEKPWKYLIAGASLLCFSFLGFDSVTAFAEEVENPEKTIPSAILLVTLIGGVLFISVSYFAYQVWPDYLLFSDLDSASADIIRVIGGNLFYALFLTVVSLGIVGSALSSQASGSRILYAMGRDGQLPRKIFGMLHPKYKIPTFNILLIGLISIAAIFLNLELVASFINFGAFIAFTMVNISVIVLFLKERDCRVKNIVMLFFLPLIGALLDFWLFINLDNHALLLGSIWFLLGILYLLFLTKGFKSSVLTRSIMK